MDKLLMDLIDAMLVIEFESEGKLWNVTKAVRPGALEQSGQVELELKEVGSAKIRVQAKVLSGEQVA
jgi:hypothetical protein